jgi:hypothetical protein
VVLGFDGWDVTAVLVEPEVVEPVDPLGGGNLDAVQGPPRAAGSDQLGLVQPELGLRGGVEAPMSSGVGDGLLGAERVADEGEGFAGDVALEDAQGVVAGVALLASFLGEVTGSAVVDHLVVGDGPQGAVGGAVAPAAEAVALSLPAARLDGAGAAEGGEGSEPGQAPVPRSRRQAAEVRRVRGLRARTYRLDDANGALAESQLGAWSDPHA